MAGDDFSYSQLRERIADGLLGAADAAIGLGYGNRRESDAVLHSRFIANLRTAEQSAKAIAHYRGLTAQGIAWARMATKLGMMLDKSAGAATQQTIANVMLQDHRNGRGRGPLWVKMGEMLRWLSDDITKAAHAPSDRALVIGNHEFVN